MEAIREGLSWGWVWICSVTPASFVDKDITPPTKGLVRKHNSRRAIHTQHGTQRKHTNDWGSAVAIGKMCQVPFVLVCHLLPLVCGVYSYHIEPGVITELAWNREVKG